MLINLRNALMSGKRLPYDAEVEYLESSGTQYIDTGFKANTTTTRLDIELMLTQSATNMGLFGSRNTTGTSGSSSCNAFFLSANQAFRMDWASGGGPFFNCLPNTAYSISITRGSVTINGSTTTYTNTDSVDQENNFLIFSFAEGSGVVYRNGMIGRVFGAKIYSNGVLVRDFIPVRKGTVGYLYDRVSGKLFGNAGTGDFVVGQDVVPVEYIESHGTEWIDTGITVSGASNLTYDVMACAVDQAVNQRVFSTDGLTPNYTAYYTIGPDLLSIPSGARMNIANGINFRIRYDGSTMSIAAGETVVQKSYDFQSPTGSYGLKLFARANNTASYVFKGRIIYADFAVSSVPYKLRPVRVGTEGAMMDTLTRRIYRNAGTGAFTYGNDLKYPIPSE